MYWKEHIKQAAEHKNIWERPLFVIFRMQHLRVTCFRSHTQRVVFCRFFSFQKIKENNRYICIDKGFKLVMKCIYNCMQRKISVGWFKVP